MNDPLSLKPALSQLFNNTLTDQWMSSPHKDKIFIGTHNIECTGAIKESRYRETKTGKFDGVHLFGSSGQKAYTLSVLNILKNAKLTSDEYDFHQNCAQTIYQSEDNRFRQTQSGNRNRKYKGGNNMRGNSKTENYQQGYYSIPTQNRFSGLNQKNL